LLGGLSLAVRSVSATLVAVSWLWQLRLSVVGCQLCASRLSMNSCGWLLPVRWTVLRPFNIVGDFGRSLVYQLLLIVSSGFLVGC